MPFDDILDAFVPDLASSPVDSGLRNARKVWIKDFAEDGACREMSGIPICRGCLFSSVLITGAGRH